MEDRVYLHGLGQRQPVRVTRDLGSNLVRPKPLVVQLLGGSSRLDVACVQPDLLADVELHRTVPMRMIETSHIISSLLQRGTSLIDCSLHTVHKLVSSLDLAWAVRLEAHARVLTSCQHERGLLH